MLISICIPAYKRTAYLKRLLHSIAIQTFKDLEVIVSDDSPDNSVQIVCEEYQGKFKLLYYKNEVALGTPANWNFGISKASGEWIKLMHDDDWFANENALAMFAEHTNKSKLIFSAYTNHYENGTIQEVYLRHFWSKKITKEPAILIAENVIGPPSVTLIHSSIKEQYDERLPWRVDIEFYYRILKQTGSYYYINQPLVNVGISESQVTQSCLYKPEVELPEGYILLQKQGIQPLLRHILVYDAWWRLLRNMNITTQKQLEQYGNKNWPAVIINMVNDLDKVPRTLLNIGAFSKILMTISYLKNKKLVEF
ncbi:glycosyltransferase family 2 protein [Ilyomonas limi]|uniref:Glycosyltransferase family 2 protein n=1 Tax=Ilyomonas limi TaxID=2575867 RepID=A0A4U3L247_9BACT|nr:glycosyltransferase family 2 protein [Ilyomonas limi]TKK68922.1 glycosyltransferase family 2 protein [Ilyomonas limi]